MPNQTYEYHRKYYLEHQDRLNQQAAIYRQKNPKRVAYTVQKSNARIRGIDFLLSYIEWVNWWGEDYDRRGRGKDNLVMARVGDTGPYTLDNIIKITGSENTLQSNRRRL